MINRARFDPVSEGERLGIDITEGLTDTEKAQVGLRPPLAMNKILLGTARAHSDDMYANNYFDHPDLQGHSPFDRMEAAGYSILTAGENIAARTNGSSARLEDDLMIDDGIPGRGHRLNLLDFYDPSLKPDYFTEVGCGYSHNTHPNNQLFGDFLTQDFGANLDTPGPFLLGVVYNDSNHNNFYDAGEGIAGVMVTSDSGNFYAVTGSAGGFAFPLGNGDHTITFSGGPLASPVTHDITVSGDNYKLDLRSGVAVEGGADVKPPKPACPANVSQDANPGDLTAVVDFTIPEATDSRPGVVTNVCVPDTGSTFPVGLSSVTCTATDAAGNTASCTFVLTVVGVSFTTVDSDSDGFPDEIESTLGTDPEDPSSTPFGGSPTTAQALTLKKLGVKLTFSAANKDALALTGSFPITQSFNLAGATVAFDVAGITRQFTLSSKGASPTGKGITDTFKLKVKNTKGAVQAPVTATFTLSLKNTALAAKLADEGLGNFTGKLPVKIPIVGVFNGAEYSFTKDTLYAGVHGKSGKTL